MDLRPNEEQQQLVDAFAALYAKESSPERVRAAEPLGFDRRLWDSLRETGALDMAVDEASGGWGASLLDLALVAQEHGRALGSAPLVETQVAARLLARIGGDAAGAALQGALTGERLVTVALRPARNGVATVVPAGAVATDLVVRVGDELRLVPVGNDRTVFENVGSAPLADVPLHDGIVLASGPAAREAIEAALDDWLVLTAHTLVGMAQQSLAIGVAYVVEREAFGQKIGGFQAIGHRLADVAAATDGAELLAHESAWAAAEDPDRAGQLAAMAFAFAAETARDTSYWALHFHGGYGFMLEYDIQLYFRRSRAWANTVMSPAQAYQRVADRRDERTLGHGRDRSGTARPDPSSKGEP